MRERESYVKRVRDLEKKGRAKPCLFTTLTLPSIRSGGASWPRGRGARSANANGRPFGERAQKGYDYLTTMSHLKHTRNVPTHRYGLSNAATILVLATVNLWFYRSGIVNAFFGNDLYFIYSVSDLPSALTIFSMGFQEAMRNAYRVSFYRPLFGVIIRGLHTAFGMDFTFWHLGMLLVHIFNTVLVWILFRRLFRRSWLAAGGALLWSIGWYKADAVMWIACAHVWTNLVLFLALAAGPRLRGNAGVILRLALVALAVLIHESAWPFAVVIVLQVWLDLREKPRHVAATAAGVAVLAIPFAITFRRIAAGSLFPNSEFNLAVTARNYLPLVTELFAPFQLGFNKANQWLASHGRPPIGWLHILVAFWAAVALGLWRLFSRLPALPRRLARDRIFWWGVLWTLVLLIPSAQYEPWLHGRHAYMISVGLVLALGRFTEHWIDLSPKKRPTPALVALLVLLAASQVAFSLKVRAHMELGNRQVPGMVADLKANEPPPREGETWVITNFPFYEQEVQSFLRFDYGIIPPLKVYPGDAPELPAGKIRVFKYDHQQVKLVRTR